MNKTVFEHLRERLMSRVPPDNPLHLKNVPSYEELKKSQWCPDFENYMRNRLIMGFFRYGPFSDAETATWKHVESALKRLHRYNDGDRNLEHLVDAANLCMLQYVWGLAHGEKFESQDDVEDLHSQKA